MSSPHYPTLEELFGGSATVGGPRPEQPGGVPAAAQQEAQTAQQGALTKQRARNEEFLKDARTAAEIGASIVAPELAAGRLIRPVSSAVGAATRSPLVEAVVQGLGRMTFAGAGGLGGSEVFAPADETPDEADARRWLAVAESAGGEALSPVAQKVTGTALNVGGRVTRRAAQSLEPLAVEAQRLLRQYGGSLTVGQGRTGFLIDTLENILEVSFLGGQRYKTQKFIGQQAALEALDDAMPEVARVMTPQEVGKLVDIAIKDSSQIARAHTRAMYGALDNAIQQAGGTSVVDISPVALSMKDALNEAVLAGDKRAKGIVRLLDAFAGAPVTFKQAEKIRSALLSISRSGKGLLPDVRRVASNAAKQVDDQITVSGTKLGPLGQDVLTAFRDARAASRESHTILGDKLIGNLIGKVAPEDLARSLFQADSPSRIQALRRIIYEPRYRSAVGDPNQVWAQIQATFLQSLRREAGEGVSHTGQAIVGEIDGKALRQALETSGGTFTELFPSLSQRRNLMTAARALELTQGKAGASRSGSILMQMKQATAASKAVQTAGIAAESGLVGAAYLGVGPAEPGFQWSEEGVILLSPPVLAYLLTRPRFVSFMLERAKAAPARSGKASGAVLAQLIARVREEGVPFLYQSNSGETIEMPGGSPMHQLGPTASKGADFIRSLKPVSKQ